jgi:hypothetical protein
MPSASQILLGLSSIANEWRPVAIAWHAVLAVSVLAIVAGWRPSARAAAYALVSPLLSVSVAALVFGNVFNAIAFTALFAGLSAVARHFSSEPLHIASPVVTVVAAFLVAFGWGYPHFVETNHWREYTYAAPFGLLPCPTLALVTGLSIMCGQFGSRGWTLTLAAAGLVYGAIGVFVLGVTLDVVLLGGALAAVTTSAASIQHKTLAGSAT